MRLTTTQPGGEEIAFLDAARLHARRFDRLLVTSIVLLRSADELIIDPAGGVLAITHIKHAKRGVALLALLYTSALVALAWSILTSHWFVAAGSVVGVLATLATVAPRAIRRMKAVRQHECKQVTWLVTDVAAEPGRGAGDRLVVAAINAAGASGANLVLSVRQANASAVRLYRRHEFVTTVEQDGLVRMKRSKQQPA
jgi:ribosomal protein S18 acetylase RimI-like enzyme